MYWKTRNSTEVSYHSKKTLFLPLFGGGAFMVLMVGIAAVFPTPFSKFFLVVGMIGFVAIFVLGSSKLLVDEIEAQFEISRTYAYVLGGISAFIWGLLFLGIYALASFGIGQIIDKLPPDWIWFVNEYGAVTLTVIMSMLIFGDDPNRITKFLAIRLLHLQVRASET